MIGLAGRDGGAGWRGGRAPRPVVLAAAFLLALAAFLPGLTALPPIDRDEARFAQASRQMLETGDFLDIRFQDQPRHAKPAGAYWLQAASAALVGGAGAPIWAYRLPSLVGAAAAAALTVWAGRPLVGARAAALAGLMLAATPLLQVEARLAKTDALLLACVVLAMGALARVRFAAGGRRWAPLFWAAVGAGVLVKGPIVLIPAAGAVGWLAATGGAGGLLRDLRPGLGLGIVAVIAGPWLLAITWTSGGGFWVESFGRDLLAKAAAAQESHGAPPGAHLAFLAAGFWPWAALLPLAAAAIWAGRRSVRTRFLLGWLLPTWALFELTPTKLPHYVLPAYPALALLLAAALLRRGAALWRAASRWRRGAALALWAAPAAALPLAAALAVPLVEGRAAWGAVALAALAAAPLALAGRALARGRLGAFPFPAALGAAAAAAALLHGAIPRLDRAFPARAMAQAAAACAPDGPVAVAGFREPSAVFLLGTDTLMTDGPGAAAALADGRAALAFVADRARPGFDAAAPGARPVGRVEGFNYANGRPVALTLMAPPGQGGRCGHGT